MLSLLHDEMAKSSIMSILYSDIGDYYSKVKRQHVEEKKRSGWESMSSKHVIWEVECSDIAPEKSASTRVAKLEEADIARICEHDADLLRREVLASRSHSAFTVVPTEDQYDWQFRRTRFFDELRHPPSRYSYPRITDAGCQIGQPGDEDWAFAIWSYDVIVNELNILRLRCNNAEDLRALVRHAHGSACKQGMKTITAWNVDEKLLESTGWRNVERKDHMPALAWYGEGDSPEWVCNEVG